MSSSLSPGALCCFALMVPFGLLLQGCIESGGKYEKPATTCKATISVKDGPSRVISIINKNIVESIQCQHEHIDKAAISKAEKAGKTSTYSCWTYQPDARDASEWRCIDECTKRRQPGSLKEREYCFNKVEFKGSDGQWHRSHGSYRQEFMSTASPQKGKCVKVGKPQPVQTCKSILGNDYDCSKGLGQPQFQSKDNDCSKGTGCTFNNGVLTGVEWGLSDACSAVTRSNAVVAPLCCKKNPPAGHTEPESDTKSESDTESTPDTKKNNDQESNAKLYSEGPLLHNMGVQAILPIAGFVFLAVVAAGALALVVKRRRSQGSNALMSSIDEDDTGDIE